jgi:FtsP/CotA-like multicopper oxidase with cupredoxin domain
MTRRRTLVLMVGAAATTAVIAASCDTGGPALPAAAPRPTADVPGHDHPAPSAPPERRPAPPPPSPAVDHFGVALPLLSALQPVHADDTADYYQLTERMARVEILPGLQTTIWGYNGAFPGPLIRAKRGRTARISVSNQLTTDTVVHLHGGLTPPESDGFPMDLIPPGGGRDYTYPNDRRAATLWYHDHAMGSTGKNIYMGLAGMYVVDDDAEKVLGLPSGEFDVPLVIMNRQFTSSGELLYPDGNKFGATGDVMLVNGAPWPRLEVARCKYRFRVLNASNSDSYTLALSDGQPLVQIATEGGLLPAPVDIDSLPLGMGERADLVVDFATYAVGSQVVLQNAGGAPGLDEIIRFDVVRDASDVSRLPSTLSAIQPWREADAVRTRNFTFEETQVSDAPAYGWTINGQSFDPGRVDALPDLNDIEVWTFKNVPFPGVPFQVVHPVHVHLVNFLILDRDGRPPAAHEAGWKDTVVVHPNEQVRVIMRFEGYRGRYLIHCHNLEHEDHAMMARFDVA